MRLVLLLVVPVGLGSCAGSFVAECNKSFNAVCAHQVSCELAFDYAECETKLNESWYCDEVESTIAELQTCTAAAEALDDCSVALPTECGDAWCSPILGCGGDTTTTTRPETARPPGDTGPR